VGICWGWSCEGRCQSSCCNRSMVLNTSAGVLVQAIVNTLVEASARAPVNTTVNIPVSTQHSWQCCCEYSCGCSFGHSSEYSAATLVGTLASTLVNTLVSTPADARATRFLPQHSPCTLGGGFYRCACSKRHATLHSPMCAPV
jgi:hypothetical protein